MKNQDFILFYFFNFPNLGKEFGEVIVLCMHLHEFQITMYI